MACSAIKTAGIKGRQELQIKLITVEMQTYNVMNYAFVYCNIRKTLSLK